MVQKLISLFLAILFFASSILLPLADFSLLPDIPDMYRNYAKITTSEELGIIDFIGDYLLHGKELFGNNTHDKTPTGRNNVQFQHRENSLNVVFLKLTTSGFFVQDAFVQRPLFMPLSHQSAYAQEIFRPPLA